MCRPGAARRAGRAIRPEQARSIPVRGPRLAFACRFPPVTEQAERPRPADPLRLATPRIDDVEARRARAAVASRIFGGPREPVRVGRYQVLGRIGTGGMGVVYRAHDPELARDVAVKLMNAEAIGDDQTATARARLVREARAMARLAHPNVIHVYDVGSVEDGIFIAMELVEGESLATWLRPDPDGERRDWLEVLRVYVDAGRGLCAAHAAGIVHRDFKPENVLVGSDGRVRVGDFGLAGAPTLGESESAELLPGGDADVDDIGLAGSLTRTGALLGTPKYMAPEQEHGAIASARSDQFSFCVALYEGLYGRPPFDGDTAARYRRNVRAGRIVGPGIDTRVRGWVYAEIARGLAVDPAARHPSMDALLDKLERALVDPRLARRSWVRRVAMSVPIIGVALGIGAWVGAGGLDDGSADEGDRSAMRADAAGLQTETEELGPPQGPAATRPGAVIPLEDLVPATTHSTLINSTTTGSATTNTATTNTATTGPESEAPGDDDSRRADERRAATPRSVAKSRSRHCYFHEDDKTSIARQASRATLVLDRRDTCYRCRPERREAIAETLIPEDGDDCSYKYLCAKEPRTACNESSPG